MTVPGNKMWSLWTAFTSAWWLLQSARDVVVLSFTALLIGTAAIFCMPSLLTINFGISALIIAQSLFRIGSLSQRRLPGAQVAEFLVAAQKVIQKVILGLVGVAHLFIVFPALMFFSFFLPSCFVLPGFVRKAILGLPERLGIEKRREIIDTPEKVVVYLWRLCVNRMGRLRNRVIQKASAGIFVFLNTKQVTVASALLSDTVWSLLNSAAIDVVFLCWTTVIRSRLTGVLSWLQGFVAVIVIAPALYFGSESQGTGAATAFFSAQYQLVMAPLGLFYYWMNMFQNAAADLDKQQYLDKQHGNARIYDKLSVLDVATCSEAYAIRLLTILPGISGQPLRCDLQVARMISKELPCPLYEALSYVWGPPDLAEAILINSREFSVSTALYYALVQLRYPRQSRTLWVDAICINQDDTAERMSQVLLMQEIYSRSSRVVVWLGEYEPLGLKRFLRQDTGSAADVQSIRFGAARVARFLLQRPWWTRAWITQELVLAKDVQVNCGSHFIHWDRLCPLINACSERPYFPTDDPEVHFAEFRVLFDYRNGRLPKKALDKELETRRRLDRSTDLLALIYDFRSRQATDSRDKVFAFQGLAQGREVSHLGNGLSVDSFPPLVRPDYTRRDSFLCIDLARRHIRRTRSLAIVALAECARQEIPEHPDTVNDNRQQYIPSWAPAFMNIDGVKAGLQWRPFWTGLPDDRDTTTKFSAAGEVPINILPADPDIIAKECGGPDQSIDDAAICEGYPHKLDIEILSGAGEAVIEVGLRAGGSIVQLLDETIKVINRQSSAMQDSFQARMAWDSVLPLWRLTAKDAYSRRKATGYCDPPFEELFHLTITGGKFGAHPDCYVKDNVSRPLLRNVYLTRRSARINAETVAYLKAREETCYNRTFFITGNDQFGIGPAQVKIGDEVRAVLGMQVPAILRKITDVEGREGSLQYSPDDWVYIGQAYVHDMMVCREELVNSVKRGDALLEKRVLT